MTNLENDDGSPVFKIYERNRFYNFFVFTLTAADIIIFGDNFQKSLSIEEFASDKSFNDFTELQRRRNSLIDALMLTKSDEEQNSFSELSLNQILFLLTLIDELSKYLLSTDDANSLKLKTEVGKVSGIGDNWESFYFTEAQFVLDEMKDTFKSFPEIIEVITNTKGQSVKLVELLSDGEICLVIG
jgi:superfamily I DNA/RNA helicase